jgi:membrane protein involved in colicin uptake
LQVDERYKDGNPNWFDDAADAEHVRALAAARAEAEARRLAEEADKRAKEAADADAKKQAEEEAAAQRAKAETEAAERKRAQVMITSSSNYDDNITKDNIANNNDKHCHDDSNNNKNKNKKCDMCTNSEMIRSDEGANPNGSSTLRE